MQSDFPVLKLETEKNIASYTPICHTRVKKILLSQVNEGWDVPTFILKAEGIDANAVAESSNIQLKGNRFLKNKIEAQRGGMLMALDAGGCHKGVYYPLLLRVC